MKTAVVTGASGFIGGALTQRLLEGGYTVYGVGRKSEYLRRFDNEQFIPVVADLSEKRLSDLIARDVDVFYYLSWGGTLGGKDLYDVRLQMDNAAVAAAVCEDAAQFAKRFIFVSSSYESMKNEHHPQYPFNVYGIAKHAAADICASVCMRAGVEYNKVILTNTYGVGDRSKKAVNTIITAMLSGSALKLVQGDRPNDWMYIDDTVSGLVAAYERGVPFESYYLGHKEITTFREKILAMGQALCAERTFAFGEMPEETFIDYEELRCAVSEKLMLERADDFQESIQKTAAWLEACNAENAIKSTGG